MANLQGEVVLPVDQDAMCDHFRKAINVDEKTISNKTIKDRFAQWKASVGLPTRVGIKKGGGGASEGKAAKAGTKRAKKSPAEKKPRGKKAMAAKEASEGEHCYGDRVPESKGSAHCDDDLENPDY